MLFSRKSASHHRPSPALPTALKRAPALESPVRNDIAAIGSNGTHTQSFIDASLTIVGDLLAEGDVRLDGRICGNVRCAQLVVGKDGAITGAVIAHEAIVRGRITGTIRSHLVVIQDTAHVESEITYSALAIDHGAFFEGTVRRRHNPLEDEASSPLLELQQVARAAEGAPVASEKTAGDGSDMSAEPAHLVPQAANGKAATPNSHAPMAGAHRRSG